MDIQNFTATLKRIIYCAPQHKDGAVFAVLAFAAGREEIVAAGNVAPDLLGQAPEGGEFALQGRWVEHKKYGRQLQIISLLPVVSRSERGLIRYLTRFDGIGEATARKVVAALGLDFLQELSAAPQKIDAVPDLTDAQRRAVLQAVDAWAQEEAGRQFIPWLLAAGLTMPQAVAAVRRFRENTQAELTRRPWLLMDLEGVGFLTADKFARAVGADPRSAERIAAAVLHVLGEARSEGHVFSPLDGLAVQTAALLEKCGPPDAVPAAERVRRLIEAAAERDQVVLEDGRVYLPYLYDAEQAVLAWLRRRVPAVLRTA